MFMVGFVIIGSLYCLFWYSKCWNTFLQVRDYSGTYTVKLVPCTAPPGVEYSFRPVCHPREPITFDLDIRFQQVIITESQALIKGCIAELRGFLCVCVCVVRCELQLKGWISYIPLYKSCITVIINKTISSEMSWTNRSVWLDRLSCSKEKNCLTLHSCKLVHCQEQHNVLFIELYTANTNCFNSISFFFSSNIWILNY